MPAKHGPRAPALIPENQNPLARRQFLEAVYTCVPEALDELRQIAPSLPERDYPSVPADWEAEAPLREWALARGFVAPRVEGHAGDHTDWLLTEARRIAAAMRVNLPVGGFTYSFRLPDASGPTPAPYDPTAESEATYDGRIEQDKIERATRATGFRVPPRKRTPQHFEWLAYYQVGRLEYVEIKRRCKVPTSVDSIRSAVIETAREVGLTLRLARRGRPSESREK